MQKLSDILQTLGIALEVDDDALVTDLVVVGKVQRMNGSTTVVTASTEGTDWITKIGLMQVATKLAGQLEEYGS